MKVRWFIFQPIVLILFFSCSTSLRVTSEECSGRLYLAKLKGSKLSKLNRVSKLEEKKLTSFSFIGNTDTIYLGEFLRKKRMDCRKKQALSLTIKNTWSDVVLSLVPFINRTTVRVSIGPLRRIKKK
ncbi:MAG: hypothetical protein VXY34_05065 [Bdellovibrionota bacterium]|nr:hypothetical protein [Bdellovibrionota bacterium]MEC8624169.1 hypothetical protein [Bdellovibrionota bacterium]